MDRLRICRKKCCVQHKSCFACCCVSHFYVAVTQVHNGRSRGHFPHGSSRSVAIADAESGMVISSPLTMVSSAICRAALTALPVGIFVSDAFLPNDH